MTISYSKFFDPTVLTTGAVILLTIPSTPTTTLLRGARMRLVNTTASARTVTLYNVPVSGSPVVGNEFCSAKSIAAFDYLDIDVPIIPAGATLQALADANTAITATMLSGSYFS